MNTQLPLAGILSVDQVAVLVASALGLEADSTCDPADVLRGLVGAVDGGVQTAGDGAGIAAQ